MTLVEFLRARIAEDDALARECLTDAICPWGQEDWAEIGAPSRWHIARHDPARVLAECEAKRRIVEECSNFSDAPWAGDYEMADVVELADAALCALALPYADHPDYDERWRP